jgi:16S rRNA (adenine1518-N6/adenine1519-N6)-dimethyltransferase
MSSPKQPNSTQHQARKRFGQNFLHDKNIIGQIIGAVNPTQHQHLVEVGPGLGALTYKLLPYVKQLDVIEIDKDLIARFEAEENPGLVVHAGDVLKFDFSSLNKQPICIVGNLPYNISTPLLFHLVNYRHLISAMYFMLQKEVVEKICTAVNTPNYGRLSVVLQYYFHTNFLFGVPPTAFSPAPKVDSGIIELLPRKLADNNATDDALFERIVKKAFMHRRKTITNNLKGLMSAEQITAAGIDPKARPQAMSVDDFVRLANQLG